jgi:hypothetical protein
MLVSGCNVITMNMKKKTNFRKIAMLSTAALAILGMASCVPLAAGAVGYVAHKEGYRVQNPIKKKR